MRITIISDTHFGDPMGTLVTQDGDMKATIGPQYPAFKAAAGKNNNYLILVGDIFDFSISSYKEAYETAKVFFLQIQEDQIAEEIIFIPGNHDVDLWHTVEYETNIINQIKKHKPQRPFRRSVPGFIDDRKDSKFQGFTLSGVTAKKDPEKTKYAGLFLDHITEPEGKSTPFNFAYPNVYMVTDNESVMITHGHYLETYWALVGEWSLKIIQEDLRIGESMDLSEMTGINFPLSQLACSGVGQAGPLTNVIRQVQRDIKDGKLERISKYLSRLENELDNIARFPWYKPYLEWMTDAAFKALQSMILNMIKEAQDTRYNEEFIYKKDVQERFRNFYNATICEIHNLNMKYKYSIPVPWYVIFGHTHQPTSWGDENAPKTKPILAADMKPVTLYNTGGWLKDKNDKFCGAEIFIYESGKGFSSVSIR
ncbi:metallophosphoesterase [Candidatus Sumerlaeota bacterium]|nr:metallophosphoesterase [Candidatus Sumerlaeota bacterium]